MGSTGYANDSKWIMMNKTGSNQSQIVLLGAKVPDTDAQFWYMYIKKNAVSSVFHRDHVVAKGKLDRAPEPIVASNWLRVSLAIPSVLP